MDEVASYILKRLESQTVQVLPISKSILLENAQVQEILAKGSNLNSAISKWADGHGLKAYAFSPVLAFFCLPRAEDKGENG